MECTISLCETLRSIGHYYRCWFHPISHLQQSLAATLEQWPVWQDSPIPAGLTIVSVTSPHISALDSKLFPSACVVEEKVQTVRKRLVLVDPLTLFRPKLECDLAANLASIVTNLMKTGTKIKAAAETFYTKWCEHQLRSRARATALRLWSFLPDLWAALLCALALATLCLSALPTMALYSDASNKLLKSVTKAMDNTLSLCNCDKNRWSEAHAILSSWAASTLDWLAHHTHVLNVS